MMMYSPLFKTTPKSWHQIPLWEWMYTSFLCITSALTKFHPHISCFIYGHGWNNFISLVKMTFYTTQNKWNKESWFRLTFFHLLFYKVQRWPSLLILWKTTFLHSLSSGRTKEYYLLISNLLFYPKLVTSSIFSLEIFFKLANKD